MDSACNTGVQSVAAIIFEGLAGLDVYSIHLSSLSMSTSSFESVNFDEFSLENPINRFAGRRSRLVYLSQDGAHFAEGSHDLTDDVLLANSALSVEDLFNKGWRHGRKARPQIQGIFKILWPDSNLEPYLQHRFDCHSK